MVGQRVFTNSFDPNINIIYKFFCLMLLAKGLGLYDGQILYKLFF